MSTHAQIIAVFAKLGLHCHWWILSNKEYVLQLRVENNDNNQNTGNNQNQNVAYFKIPVSFEITGNYLGYLKFRRALAQSNKVINFDMEKISIVKGAGINSVGTISIVGLPDEYKK